MVAIVFDNFYLRGQEMVFTTWDPLLPVITYGEIQLAWIQQANAKLKVFSL